MFYTNILNTTNNALINIEKFKNLILRVNFIDNYHKKIKNIKIKDNTKKFINLIKKTFVRIKNKFNIDFEIEIGLGLDKKIEKLKEEEKLRYNNFVKEYVYNNIDNKKEEMEKLYFSLKHLITLSEEEDILSNNKKINNKYRKLLKEIVTYYYKNEDIEEREKKLKAFKVIFSKTNIIKYNEDLSFLLNAFIKIKNLNIDKLLNKNILLDKYYNYLNNNYDSINDDFKNFIKNLKSNTANGFDTIIDKFEDLEKINIKKANDINKIKRIMIFTTSLTLMGTMIFNDNVLNMFSNNVISLTNSIQENMKNYLNIDMQDYFYKNSLSNNAFLLSAIMSKNYIVQSIFIKSLGKLTNKVLEKTNIKENVILNKFQKLLQLNIKYLKENNLSNKKLQLNYEANKLLKQKILINNYENFSINDKNKIKDDYKKLFIFNMIVLEKYKNPNYAFPHDIDSYIKFTEKEKLFLNNINQEQIFEFLNKKTLSAKNIYIELLNLSLNNNDTKNIKQITENLVLSEISLKNLKKQEFVDVFDFYSEQNIKEKIKKYAINIQETYNLKDGILEKKENNDSDNIVKIKTDKFKDLLDIINTFKKSVITNLTDNKTKVMFGSAKQLFNKEEILEFTKQLRLTNMENFVKQNSFLILSQKKQEKERQSINKIISI